MKRKYWAIVFLPTVLILLFVVYFTASYEKEVPSASATGAYSHLPGATVSGTIRHQGNPVQGVSVEIVSEGESHGTATDINGEYSISGVPTGGLIQIFIRPAVSDRLAFRNWGTETLAGDLVKDFDLVSGFRLQGEIRAPDGSPFNQPFWLGTNPIDYYPPPGEWVGDGVDGTGHFDMVLTPGIYRLKADPLPDFIPPTTLNLMSSDVLGQVITLIEDRPPRFPITPPDASLITVGDPDKNGQAIVSGTSGAVDPFSAVAVINLSSHNITRTISGADGAFETTLFAPPGSALLVKYDPDGESVNWIWDEAQNGYPDGDIINPLPGTILPVGPPFSGDATTQAFHTAGAWLQDMPTRGWVGWWLTGTVQVPSGTADSRLSVAPGDQLTVTARLHVTSPALDCSTIPPLDPIGHLHLQALFGTGGRAESWGIWFNAHLFTPTGLPIEREGSGQAWPGTAGPFTNRSCTSPHTFEGDLETVLTVPLDMNDGVIRPQLFLDPNVAAFQIPFSSDVPLVKVWYHLEPMGVLPPVAVGSPDPPRIPWTILADYPINGHRGVQAREDVGVFAMPTRIRFPPARVVIPRLDERTGAPLVYRLEPGSHWLSATDRRQPNPPHIPLAFPSGWLSAVVHKPDGSIDTLGPAPFLQSSVRTPTTPGGAPLDHGTGHIGDLYHLSTMDEAFAYSFDQYGDHTITLNGEVEDIYGGTYAIESTYDLTVARVLDLDPAQLPTTPYEQGDAFAPGLHVFPPVPAHVTVNLLHLPDSNPANAISTTISGQANRFGYFQPESGTVITMTNPGEFRVDITADYAAPDGTLWAGAMTWGNVVEGENAKIEAHGRRGMDYHGDALFTGPWFIVDNLPPEEIGIEVYYPYFSGDIHWGNEDRQPGDSIHSIITIKDLTGGSETIYNILRDHFPRNRNCFRWPPDDCSPAGLEKRLAVHEAPLFITTQSGDDPSWNPTDIDLWGYWYGSSERPDVHVREILSEDNMGTAYWRFDDTYGYQIGEGALGDLPGDLKWEFGGAVLRTITDTNPLNEYAIYSSLWVLLPHGCDAFGCARVTPPFQDATGASVNGGPIMTLLGDEIDMLFLPKGVRPGDILEVGDTVSFSGHVGPPLNSRVELMIKSPSSVTRSAVWRANKIGWLYDPTFDFVADEPGRWTVTVFVEHDQPYVGNGIVPLTHNTGTVLGTHVYNNTYEFYVVEPDAPRLLVTAPQPGFIAWPNAQIEPIAIQGHAPSGTTAVHYTIHDKGVLMGQGTASLGPTGTFTFTYDAEALHQDFSMLSLTAHEGRWEGLADEVAINFLAVGAGQPQANTVTLIGEEVFIGGGDLPWIFLPITRKDGS